MEMQEGTWGRKASRSITNTIVLLQEGTTTNAVILTAGGETAPEGKPGYY
jgi:hypothetical protein